MASTLFGFVVDVLQFVAVGPRSRSRLAAENLFLRKQLALYLECQVKPLRASYATRLTLVVLAHFIEWRQCSPSCGRYADPVGGEFPIVPQSLKEPAVL